MSSITVKNIPEDTYEMLKNHARVHHRSINSEIIYIIEKETHTRKVNKAVSIRTARALREKSKRYRATARSITRAKQAGRP